MLRSSPATEDLAERLGSRTATLPRRLSAHHAWFHVGVSRLAMAVPMFVTLVWGNGLYTRTGSFELCGLVYGYREQF